MSIVRVCAIQKLNKIHLIANYSNLTSLRKGVPALHCHVQNMSNASELPDKLLSSGTSEIHRDCGITVPPHPLRETLWERGCN